MRPDMSASIEHALREYTAAGSGTVFDVYPELSGTVVRMRELGIRRMCTNDQGRPTEIELEPTHPDTIRAPGPDLDDAIASEGKPAGTCAHGACTERAGFHFAPHLCERHGLSQFGVKT